MAELDDLLPLIERGPDGAHPDASPERLKSFRFSIGNSGTGPVGYVIRVRALTSDEALEIVQEFIPETVTIRHSERGTIIDYAQVYFNTDVVTTADIEEWGYADEEE